MRCLPVLIIRSFLRSKAMEVVLKVLIGHDDLGNSISSSSFVQDPKNLGTALLGILCTGNEKKDCLHACWQYITSVLKKRLLNVSVLARIIIKTNNIMRLAQLKEIDDCWLYARRTLGILRSNSQRESI